MKENHFEIMEANDGIRIIIDKETGVHYLNTENGGLCPLVYRDGQPMVGPAQYSKD